MKMERILIIIISLIMGFVLSGIFSSNLIEGRMVTPAPTPTGTPAPTPGGTDTASYDGITKSVCNTNDKDTLQTNCYCPLDVKDGVTCANPRQIRDDEMCFRNVPGCTNSSVAGHRGVKCMSGEPGTYCP